MPPATKQPTSASTRAASPVVPNAIRITTARTHNLKGISLDIPRDQLVVITGVSGSGKSSLAFDTIYAEGQRRYLATVSAYSRSFLDQLERPDVERIDGLPPTVSVSQKTGSVQSRSVLATTTEIFDYLRLLYARAGVAHSPATGARVERQTVEQIADAVARFGERSKIVVLAPVVRGRKGEHRAVFERLVKEGLVRARVDGETVDLSDPPKLAKTKTHTIEAVVDRLVIKQGVGARLRESLELALKLGEGLCTVSVAAGESWRDHNFSEKFVCPDTGESFPPLEPRSFSFNSPYGACPTCHGLGVIVQEGTDEQTTANSAPVCEECHGERLNSLTRLVTLAGLRLPALLGMPVTDAAAWSENLLTDIAADHERDLTSEGKLAVAKALPEVVRRLRYLDRVGLGYLTLGRPTRTLSGGEYQRARLSGCLGSGLRGVCYILDEPTIGLHPHDIGKLIETLRDLRDAGNSVLLVEHDLAVMRAADLLIDLGPGAGAEGGRLMAIGTPAQVASTAGSPTATFLNSSPGSRPAPPRPIDDATPRLELTKIQKNNLGGIDVSIPLGRFVAVTGVSGSGKSTLVNDVMVPAVQSALLRNHSEGHSTRCYGSISGADFIKRVVLIDQSPLGRTARSTPATYSGLWDEVRKVFARTKEARIRGYTASRFSFLSAAGRCPECKGQGTYRIEMAFLPDVTATCPACGGKRFNRQTLAVTFKGLNAAEILLLRIDQAVEVFAEVPRVRDRLKLMSEVGLGYLQLGQSSLTLSGGEAQRVKLATELSLPGKVAAEATLYVLDEPTTGLHPRDTEKLVGLLQGLVADGHTVLAIEHEPAFIAAADWVIDLGPGGGAAGGLVVAACPPGQLSSFPESLTGKTFGG